MGPLCHCDSRSSRSSGLRPSLARTLTSRPRIEFGPPGQPAQQSVLVGQLVTRPTYAGSRRGGFYVNSVTCWHILRDMSASVDNERAQLRAELRVEFRDIGSFDAFCIDYFLEIGGRFGMGMERTERENLLFKTIEPQRIQNALDSHRLLLSANRRARRKSKMRAAFFIMIFSVLSALSTIGMMKHFGQSAHRNYVEEFAECILTERCTALFSRGRSCCSDGESESCLLTAVMASKGTGTPKDQSLALSTSENLCDNNYLIACYTVGRLLLSGSEIPTSRKRAMSLFQKACEHGFTPACVSLASLYLDGRLLEKDYNRAKNYYQIACDAGIALGCTGLGALYDVGQGVAKDVDEALRLYAKACNQNEPLACRNIGKVYQEGEPSRFPSDPIRAVSYFQKSCAMKGASGCNSLGYAYRHGYGLAKDSVQAFLQYQKSCLLGDPRGCANLAELYETGDGVARNLEIAFQHYHSACDQGYSDGCLGMGRMYRDGKFVAANPSAARELFESECRRDVQEGCELLKQEK